MKNIFNILKTQYFKLINKKFEVYKYNNQIVKKITHKQLKNLNIFIIKKGKIFTNSVDDAAYLTDNLVLTEPSYQYRNSKNASIKKNIIFKTGTNRLIKKFNGKIISIISGGAAKSNYGHWLFDSISRLLIILKKKEFKNFDYLYVPSYKHQYQKDTFKYLKLFKKKIISSEKNKFIEGNEIICTNHPFDHRFDKISRITINDIRKNFLKFSKFSKIEDCKKIYIERDYSNFNLKKNLIKYKDQRILINNNDVKKYLSKLGFISFKLKYLSFADQIKLFSKAKIIVCMFGAELSNLVFCKKGTKIIEIKNNRKLDDYKNLSKKCSLKHVQINLKPIFKTKVIQNGILNCNIKKIKNLL